MLVAEADEERNISDVGMSWLVRERPDLRCDFAINEGGGARLDLADGRTVVTVAVGEKIVTSAAPARLRHGGPRLGPDPHRQRAPARVERRRGAARLPSRRCSVLPSVAAALEALGAPEGQPAEAIAWAAAQHPLLADELPAMTRMTVTPTGLRTYEPANVIPPFVDVTCDCRALPGQDEGDIAEHVERALGDGFAYEFELLEPPAGGTESPTDTPLYEALREYIAARIPGAEPLPLLGSGFTDSHYLRKEWGTVAYGFAPVLFGDVDAYMDAAHAADEAIEIADLVEMADFHRELVTGAFG